MSVAWIRPWQAPRWPASRPARGLSAAGGRPAPQAMAAAASARTTPARLGFPLPTGRHDLCRLPFKACQRPALAAATTNGARGRDALADVDLLAPDRAAGARPARRRLVVTGPSGCGRTIVDGGTAVNPRRRQTAISKVDFARPLNNSARRPEPRPSHARYRVRGLVAIRSGKSREIKDVRCHQDRRQAVPRRAE